MNKKSLILFTYISLVLAFLIFALTAVYYYQAIRTPFSPDSDKIIVIPAKTSGLEIGEILQSNKIISNKWLFVFAKTFSTDRRPLRAGEYNIAADSTMLEVIDFLRNGKTIIHSLFIPEGLTSREIVNIINTDQSLSGNVIGLPTEGSLMPDTYYFMLGDNRQSVISRMRRQMLRALVKLWREKSDNLPYKSPMDILTLASIVEKEASASEREHIAGVFINRLRKKMPLQSDATVIYAATEGKKELDRILTKGDFTDKNGYNNKDVKIQETDTHSAIKGVDHHTQ